MQTITSIEHPNAYSGECRMRFQQYLMGPMVCALALVAGCGRSEKRAAAGDSAATASTPATVATNVAMRTFSGDPAVARQGRELFIRFNCYGCHGGLAGGAMGPSLRDTTWKFGGTDSAIFSSIHDGRPAGMPTWGRTLSKDQIATLIVYIRSLRTSAEPTFFWASDTARSQR
jgi:mono/diheme cytochrome c family protein